MRNNLVLIAVFCLSVSVVRAQSRDVFVGPVFMPGAAVSAGPVENGWKTSSRFAWSAGALADIPISASNAVVLGLVYDQRAVNFHALSNEGVYRDYTFSYVAIRPELRLSSFLIGFGLGIPASSSYETSNGTTTIEKSVALASVNMLAEVRVGTTLPIVDLPSSKLNLMIEGSYPLTKIYSNKPISTESLNNGPIATLELGLSYLFDVSK